MRRVKTGAKREQIIEAAKQVILQDGIWNVTTRKVAEAASIHLGTIHYHFESQDELILAVFAEMIAMIRAAAREDFASPEPLARTIEHAIVASWEFSERHWREQVAQSELTLYAVRTEGAARLARRQYEGFVGLYLDVFRGASDAGGRKDLDLEGLARFVLAGIDGLLQQHFAEPDDARSRKGVQKLITLAQHYPLTAGPAALTPLSLGRQARRTGGRAR